MTLTHLSSISVVFPVLIGLFRFRYLTPGLKAIFLLVVIGCAVEYATYFGIPAIFGPKGVSLPIYIAYTLLEYLLISLFYYLLARDSWQHKIIFGGTVAYIFFFFWMLTASENIMQNFGYLTTVESILIVCWILLYLRQILFHQIDMDLKRAPTFWLSTAFLLYFLGAFFLFASFGLLADDENLAVQFYDYIHSILNIILNLLICVGFYFSTRS
jgi:hypothetical protein